MKAEGKIVFSDGGSFEGLFTIGPLSGMGRFQNAQNDIYDGEVQNGEYHGLGKLRTADGRTYMGTFENGFLDGEGEFSDAEGNSYQGCFQRGKFHGFGELRRCGIMVYRGEWASDEYHGEGEILEGNYDFKGEFLQGKKSGFGIEKTDRWEYIGEYEGGKYHGQGILRRETSTAEGTFSGGDLVSGLIRCDNGDIIELKRDENLKIVKARKTKQTGEVEIGVWTYPDIVEIGEDVRDMIWRYREKLLKTQRDDVLIAGLKNKFEALQIHIEQLSDEYSEKIDDFQRNGKEISHFDVHFQHYTCEAKSIIALYNRLLIEDSENKTIYAQSWGSSAFRMAIGHRCEQVQAFIKKIENHSKRLTEVCMFDAGRLKDIMCFLQIKLQQKTRKIREIVGQSTLEFSNMSVYQIFFALNGVDDNLPELSQAEAQRLADEITIMQENVQKGIYGQNALQQKELENALAYGKFIDEMIEFNFSAQDKLEQFEESASRLCDMYHCEVIGKAKDAAKGKKIKIACGVL